MKITSSQVSLRAASKSSLTASRQQTLLINGRNTNPDRPENALDAATATRLRALNSALTQQKQAKKTDAAGKTLSIELTNEDRTKLTLLERMLEMLTGKKVKLLVPKELRLGGAAPSPAPAGTVGLAGFSLQYDSTTTITETQSMHFDARGTVQTADGRTIRFSAQLNLSRSFTQTESIHLRIGNQVDPLVLNFNGGPALGDRTFRFDLDRDGQPDQIAFVGPGSGFLALDGNGNGVIDDGSELFGPTSGDGFGELAAYDGDRNGWIDENDAIYDKLRIWTVDESGERRLLALGVKGIGAIYLGRALADFDLTTAANDTLGTVRSTGVFLKENGGVGTVQHIDLTL